MRTMVTLSSLIVMCVKNVCIILKKENMEKPSRFVTEDGSAVAFLIECSKIAEYQADFRTYRLLS